MKFILFLSVFSATAFAVTPFDIRLRQLNSTASGEVVFSAPYPSTGTLATVFYDVATKTPMVAPWDSTITYDAISGSMGIDQTWIETNYIPRSELEADWSTITDMEAYVATREADLQIQIDAKLNASAFTWANLGGKPTLFSGAYSDLTGKPSLFSGAYSSLSGIPSTFAPSAHNQAWSTITSTPTTLSGYGITDGFTAANARSAISLTTTGSGAATYNSSTGVINVPTPSIPAIQRLRVQTNATGDYTWTYPVAYGSGIVPIISCLTESSSSTVPQGVQIVGVPTNTSCTFKVINLPSTSVLSIVVLGAPTGSQAYLHLTAIAP